MQELPRLHQELGIWMSNTRYQLHDVDRNPLWRVQNTSMTVSTGMGIGAYFVQKRIRPGIKFPIDIIPPFVCFYLTHRAAQVYQMPGLWDSFLGLPSPLGATARGILEALRKGQRLPSAEFGTGLPRQPPSQRSVPASAAQEAAGLPAAESWSPGTPEAPQAPAENSTPSWGSGGFNGAAQEPTPQPPSQDPWADNSNLANLTPVSDSWEGLSGSEEAKQVPKRLSWEEIRARNAQK